MKSKVKVVVFDVGWTLFDETPRVIETSAWIREQLENVGIYLGETSFYHAYCKESEKGACPIINSLFIQTLLSLDIPLEIAVRLRKLSPWHSLPMKPYKDALDTVQSFGEYETAVLCNQEKNTKELLKKYGFFDALSECWISKEVGLKKPDVCFFGKILSAFNVRPKEVLYVGDRLDHDILPTKLFGMQNVRILQGPYSRYLPESKEPTYTYKTLSEFKNDFISPRAF